MSVIAVMMSLTTWLNHSCNNSIVLRFTPLGDLNWLWWINDERQEFNSAKNVWIWPACDHSQWPGHTQSNAGPGHTYTTNVVTISGVTVVRSPLVPLRSHQWTLTLWTCAWCWPPANTWYMWYVIRQKSWFIIPSFHTFWLVCCLTGISDIFCATQNFK